MFLYDKVTSDAISTQIPTPSLIVLCSWMGAASRPISKYVTGYQALYPSAQILLLKNELVDIFRPTPSHLSRLPPVLAVVRSNSSTDGKILLHCFSNGGANIATHLALLHNRRTGQPLPVTAVILDSCPGLATGPADGVKGFMSAFPAHKFSAVVRFLVFCAAWVLMLILFGLQRLTGGEGIIPGLRRRLNDPELIPNGSTRSYIYSDTDELVLAMDVEAHATEAEAKGWQVRREKFVGTGHVAHAMKEPQRYWGVVEETYNAGTKAVW